MKKSSSMMCIKYTTPEAKLMVLSLFYVATNLLILTALVVTLQSINTALEIITRVSLCAAGGDRPECDHYFERLHDHLLPVFVFDLISTTFIALINVVNLLFVVQYKDVRMIATRISKIFDSSTVA